MTPESIQAFSEHILVCPECGSPDVVTEAHDMFFVNGGDVYCHSMKARDYNSPATCLHCAWKGLRCDLLVERAK